MVGGCDAWNPLRSVEIYDPANNTWSQGPPLSTARRGCGLAVRKGRDVKALITRCEIIFVIFLNIIALELYT